MFKDSITIFRNNSKKLRAIIAKPPRKYPYVPGTNTGFSEIGISYSGIEFLRLKAMESVRSNMTPVWSMFPDEWVNILVGVEKNLRYVNVYVLSETYREHIYTLPTEGSFSAGEDIEGMVLVSVEDNTKVEYPVYNVPCINTTAKNVFMVSSLATITDQHRREYIRFTRPGNDSIMQHVFHEKLDDGPFSRYFYKTNTTSRKVIDLTKKFRGYTKEDHVVWKTGETKGPVTM